MRLGAQLPVRLEPTVESRLQTIAERTGSTKSALIRLLAKTFTDHVFDSGGKINLPPDWQSLLKPSDGRSTQGSSSVSYPPLRQRGHQMNDGLGSKPDSSGEAGPARKPKVNSGPAGTASTSGENRTKVAGLDSMMASRKKKIEGK